MVRHHRSCICGKLENRLTEPYCQQWSLLFMNENESEIIKTDTDVIVKPGRNIVASMAGEFREELQQLVQEGPEEIIIDMSGIEMVDSVGIGVMIAVHNSLTKHGGKLRIKNADDKILSLFSTMRLDRHFAIEGAQ